VISRETLAGAVDVILHFLWLGIDGGAVALLHQQGPEECCTDGRP